MKYVLIIFLLFPALAVAAPLEIITLKYRRAEDVIPVIQPFLSKADSVSGMGNQLILRTGNMRQIRKIIDSIDKAPRNLVITVHQGEITTGRENVYSTDSASGANESHVRVLEGAPAFIRMGRSIPGHVVTMSPYGTSVSDAYRDVSSGFYVMAHISGDTVTLEASPMYEQPVGGGIDMQKLSTKVSGKVGQWMELGGAGRMSTDSDGYHTRSDSIWIRVDLP